MTSTQFLRILRARWLLAVSLLVLALGVATALSLWLPKQYTARASVVIDVKTSDPIAGAISASVLAPSYMATQVDIMESERVALRVVRSLKMAESPDMRSQWQRDTAAQGNFESWLAQLLLRKLEVKPARESNVIEVHFTSVEPRFAATIANAFVQAYLDTVLDLRVDPARRYAAFFDERAKQLREDMEKAQTRLSTFQNTHGILAADERLDVETVRMNELSSQLIGLQTASADGRSRQVAAYTSADTLQDVIANPVVAGLRADLVRQETRLQELGSRLGDSHPSVVELGTNIGTLRSKLEQETRRLSASVTVNSIISESRESQVRNSLEAQRSKLMLMKRERDQLGALQRDTELAQKAYEGVVARQTQTLLESQTTQTNASVLLLATEPSRASSPLLVLNLMIGALAGALLAVAAVLMREAADRRVRSVEDVLRELRLPVLGTLLKFKQRSGAKSKLEGKLEGKLDGKDTVDEGSAKATTDSWSTDGKAAFSAAVRSSANTTAQGGAAPAGPQGVTVSLAASPSPGHDAPLGDILSHAGKLNADEVERILAHQRGYQMRFGEAAVALGLVQQDDVAQALSHQFRYPYAPAQSAGQHPELLMAREPFSPHAEVFRSVRAQLKIRLGRDAGARRALAVISPRCGDGKSFFAANLALAFSQSGGRTLLIDANLRSPRQHQLFGLGNETGLSNMLSGRTETLVVEPVAGWPNLFVLPVGATPPNPLELLESAGFAHVLEQVLTRFDHVVVDTTAWQYGMDAAVVAAACGTAVVVLPRQRSRLAQAQDLLAAAHDGGALVQGVVLNEGS